MEPYPEASVNGAVDRTLRTRHPQAPPWYPRRSCVLKEGRVAYLPHQGDPTFLFFCSRARTPDTRYGELSVAAPGGAAAPVVVTRRNEIEEAVRRLLAWRRTQVFCRDAVDHAGCGFAMVDDATAFNALGGGEIIEKPALKSAFALGCGQPAFAALPQNGPRPGG
jgi:hypothetical protein